MTDDIEVKNTGLQVNKDLSYDEWQEYMQQVLQRYRDARDYVDRVSMWMIGDLYCWGEDHFGEEDAAQAADQYSAETIRVAKWVARNIPPDERSAQLPFGHHQVVAKLPSDQRLEVLTEAETEGWSVNDLKKHLKGSDEKPEPQGICPACDHTGPLKEFKEK